MTLGQEIENCWVLKFLRTAEKAARQLKKKKSKSVAGTCVKLVFALIEKHVYILERNR